MVVSSCANSLIGLLILLFTITASSATRDVVTFDSDAHFDVSQICSRVKDKNYRNLIIESYPGIFKFDVKEIGVTVHGAQECHLEYCNQLYTSFLQKIRRSYLSCWAKKLHRIT
ncbi:hypothetical protein MKW94_016459 [Papaver nudicaule]|uniref:Uncharacterized protein n=1 Tax=Papaver nudicaule TaxID=74823 RepID=A0AA41VRG2_PAPNU|nr:hypothetical protein [Papaver nudicaule]